MTCNMMIGMTYGDVQHEAQVSVYRMNREGSG